MLNRILQRATAPLSILVAGATALSLGLIAPLAAEEPPAEDLGSRFTLAMVPDTQFYSRYSATQFMPKYGTDPFEVQTKWLVENRDELNIAFASHMGDIVDQESEPDQWTAADNAISVLEDAGMPISLAPGNHDTANWNSRSSESNAANYLKTFPASRHAETPGWVASYQGGLSNAYTFEGEGQEFLVIAIAWNAASSTWAWAQSVLDAHPTLPTIVTSHSIVNVDPATSNPVDDGFGQELWNELVRKNDQIFMTLNGHFHGQTNRTVKNDAGHDVQQILLDSQMDADGGNGVMGMIEFDLSGNRIDFATISPWVPLKDPATLTPSDTPVPTGPRQQYSLDIDFAERFAGFDPGFAAGTADEGDLSERAKQIVSENWNGIPDRGDTNPGTRDDYIAVDGTVAHWRFGDQPDGVVAENAEFTDVAGGSPMHRLPVAQTNPGEQLEDMTVASDKKADLSADGKAVCFANSDKTTGRLSFLTTDYEAPATRPDLSKGYTIETFVYVPGEWNATTESWTQFLSRAGRRSALPVARETSEYEDAPAFFGITNLSEFQYSTTNGRRNAATTDVWSGAIAAGAWYHIALVDNAESGALDMYVNGIRQVRSTTGFYGMTASDGYPWIIGANTTYDEPSKGWNGCVGETRVVDHPLEPSQFLTQRIDIDGEGGNFSLATQMAGTFPAGTSFDQIDGSGYPGANVRLQRVGQTDVVAEAEVGDDGTWTMPLAEAITGSGANDFTFTQSLGSRDGVPLFVTTIFDDEMEIIRPNVDAVSSARLVAGKAYLTLTATNEDTIPVDIVIATPFGSKTFAAVQPGKSVSIALNSRLAAFPAGEATVTATAQVDGAPVSRSIPVAYGAYPQQ